MTDHAPFAALHAAGYAVIPLCPPSCSCASPGKVPHIAEWQSSLFDADELATWAADGGNIGWRMGRQGDGRAHNPFLVALDVDDAEALAAWDAPLGPLPTETLSQTTPRPGVHYVWRWPEEIPPPPNAARKKAIPGVDIRSAGGQIAIAPSVHKNGGRYEFIPAEIGTLPIEWARYISDFYNPSKPKLEQAASPVSNPGRVVAGANPVGGTLSDLVSAVRAAGNGAQRDTLNAAAYTAGGLVASGRLDEMTAATALEGAAFEWEDFDPSNPWGAGQIEEIVWAGLRDGTLSPIAGRAAPLALPPPAPVEDPWGALGRRRLLSPGELKPPLWVCEGLGIAVDSKPTMVAARAGEGKTPFAAALAVAVAAGRSFLGVPVRGGGVVVLAAEGALAMQRRLVSLMAGAELPIDFVEVSPTAVASEEWRDTLTRALDATRPALVVLDTYTSAAMGMGAEHGSPEYAALALWLGAECARRETGCVLTVHIGKGRKSDERPTMHDVAGTFMLAGSASSIVILHRPEPETDPGRVEVSCGRSLSEPFAPFEARWLGHSMADDPIADPLRLERLGFMPAADIGRAVAPSLEPRALLVLALEKLLEFGEFRTALVGPVKQSASKLWAAACRSTGARFGNDAFARVRYELEQANHLVVGTDAVGVRDPESARAFILSLTEGTGPLE